jgi:outer membrane protein
MKFVIFLCSFLSISVSGWTQTSKGNFLASGSLSLRTNKTETSLVGADYETKQRSFAVAPRFGYFLIDRLALGINLPFSWMKYKSSTSSPFIPTETSGNSVGIGPFARYYFPTNDKIFVVTHVGYSRLLSNNKITFGDGSTTASKTKSNRIDLGAGITYFAAKNVGIEALVGYTILNDQSSQVVNKVVSLEAGFLYFF